MCRLDKQSTDRQAVVTIFTGRGLPTPQAMDAHIVRLVRDSRDPASTGGQRDVDSARRSEFRRIDKWCRIVRYAREFVLGVAPGVRYGLEWNRDTLQALGIDPGRAVQAPRPILRTFAPGPAITRSAALLARDAIDAGVRRHRSFRVPGNGSR